MRKSYGFRTYRLLELAQELADRTSRAAAFHDNLVIDSPASAGLSTRNIHLNTKNRADRNR